MLYGGHEGVEDGGEEANGWVVKGEKMVRREWAQGGEEGEEDDDEVVGDGDEGEDTGEEEDVVEDEDNEEVEERMGSGDLYDVGTEKMALHYIHCIIQDEQKADANVVLTNLEQPCMLCDAHFLMCLR